MATGARHGPSRHGVPADWRPPCLRNRCYLIQLAPACAASCPLTPAGLSVRPSEAGDRGSGCGEGLLAETSQPSDVASAPTVHSRTIMSTKMEVVCHDHICRQYTCSAPTFAEAEEHTSARPAHCTGVLVALHVVVGVGCVCVCVWVGGWVGECDWLGVGRCMFFVVCVYCCALCVLQGIKGRGP